MVDFNNETTIAQGSGDVVKIIRLEKRYNLFEAMEAYDKAVLLQQQAHDELIIVRARALNLFREMEGELTRKADNDKKNKAKDCLIIAELKHRLMQGSPDELEDAISLINLFCDDIGLTKIDVRKRFDSTRVELENKERKL
jgi:hypothetical protein